MCTQYTLDQTRNEKRRETALDPSCRDALSHRHPSAAPPLAQRGSPPRRPTHRPASPGGATGDLRSAADVEDLAGQLGLGIEPRERIPHHPAPPLVEEWLPMGAGVVRVRAVRLRTARRHVPVVGGAVGSWSQAPRAKVRGAVAARERAAAVEVEEGGAAARAPHREFCRQASPGSEKKGGWAYSFVLNTHDTKRKSRSADECRVALGRFGRASTNAAQHHKSTNAVTGWRCAPGSRASTSCRRRRPWSWARGRRSRTGASRRRRR